MKKLKHFYSYIISLGTHFQPILLLLMRICWGVLFIMAGWKKLIALDHTVEAFGSIGIPFHWFNAHLVAVVEFLGGLSLLLGLFARLMAIPLAITMIVALIATYGGPLGTILQDLPLVFEESAFTFLVASLVIFAFGPGRLSLDHLLKLEKN